MTVGLKRASIIGIFAASWSAVLLSTPPLAQAAEPSRPGEVFRDCADVCPEMVVVPAGAFTMGSNERIEAPPRLVTIAAPFAVGRFEVSFAEWDACVAAKACPNTPTARWGRGAQPVVSVSWDESRHYLAWLSRRTGKAYRLLTEAEWEYAARAGSRTAYAWGDDVGAGRANCEGCGSRWDGKQPAPVGSFPPNAFGLHDMHGNVWEWVEDCWVDGFEGAPSDGRARTADCPDPDERVQRGGAFLHPPAALRASVRNNYTRDARANGVGFRLARSLR